MSLQPYLELLEKQNRLITINLPLSSDFQISSILKKLEPRPVLFTKVIDSPFSVAGNLYCSKQTCAEYFQVAKVKLLHLLGNAIQQPSGCTMVEDAPCQDIVINNPDLNTLPILRHFPHDGGRYITSGVMIARHPIHGINLDFHRCMQFANNKLAVRVVRGRHFDIFLQDIKKMDVALCIGGSLNVLLAAATSVELGINELEIANSLKPLKLVAAKTVDVPVPAESEIILEGTVYTNQRHPEGPFVDITETKDIVRNEPVFEVKTITHRKDAIWHALLPGGLEHKLLMGMPREPTIFEQVNKVVKCLDVHVNPGGCSWLHAIIQIDKQSVSDVERTIRAAFAGHRSCKHVFVVDKDIDIYDPQQVEWAMATRFQGDRGLIVIGKETGSSLDPSAEPNTNRTMKMGFDLTKPLEAHGKRYEKIAYPEVDLDIINKIIADKG